MLPAAAPRAALDAQGNAEQVPFFRPTIGEEEIAEVVACLRSGWLTTGPMVGRFEAAFREFVEARHAVAVNSCTAALHLAVEAQGLAAGQAVLVPTMTFAATAEVVRYQGAIPILVDCDSATWNMDLDDAARKLDALRRGQLPGLPPDLPVVGMIPVHVGGGLMDLNAVESFAERQGLWVVEDCAHALPAAWREGPGRPWRQGCRTPGAVRCFSFYANKTITTGEGGMAVTDDEALASRMRLMSLHGMSRDAWQRYAQGGSWDYRIVAPGFKYNLTDVAAAIGVHQLRRAEEFRKSREKLVAAYRAALGDLEQLDLPAEPVDRVHAWHLFMPRLRLERLSIDRDAFMRGLRERGIGCTVHWRPLHLHPYYQQQFNWDARLFPVATRQWQRVVSLPLFPDMRPEEFDRVVGAVGDLCRQHRVRRPQLPSGPVPSNPDDPPPRPA